VKDPTGRPRLAELQESFGRTRKGGPFQDRRRIGNGIVCLRGEGKRNSHPGFSSCIGSVNNPRFRFSQSHPLQGSPDVPRANDPAFQSSPYPFRFKRRLAVPPGRHVLPSQSDVPKGHFRQIAGTRGGKRPLSRNHRHQRVPKEIHTGVHIQPTPLFHPVHPPFVSAEKEVCRSPLEGLRSQTGGGVEAELNGTSTSLHPKLSNPGEHVREAGRRQYQEGGVGRPRRRSPCLGSERGNRKEDEEKEKAPWGPFCESKHAQSIPVYPKAIKAVSCCFPGSSPLTFSPLPLIV